jgi:hypothetical protein
MAITPYQGFKTGYYAPIPNHQILRMTDLGMEECLALYCYFYDSVPDTERSYTTIHSYYCRKHGDITVVAEEADDKAAAAKTYPCYELDEDAPCDLLAEYKSTVMEGVCFFNRLHSLNTIAAQTHTSYPTCARRATKLVEAGFIRRELDPATEMYRWYVVDCFKHNNDRLLEMRQESSNPIGDMIARQRKKKATNPLEPCPDCGVEVRYNDMSRHHCQQQKERLKNELFARLNPDVQSFYGWVTAPQPQKGDNERLESLIKESDRKTVMCILNHVTHEGYWAEKDGMGRNGINSLEFVVAHWENIRDTYEKEKKQKARDYSKKVNAAPASNSRDNWIESVDDGEPMSRPIRPIRRKGDEFNPEEQCPDIALEDI